ncbi:MAG: putative ABC transport system ATP-binding protein [Gammaproteobacteria bacterium]|jgi:putative ABC transport system ATP-binding protein
MKDEKFCIALNNVGKTVETPGGPLELIRNITLNVETSEALVIKGISGSGKTTLLGLMAGLDQPSSGDIFLFGQNLNYCNEEQRASIRAGRVGFVFQSFQLVSGANALQNVLLPLELAGVDGAYDIAVQSLVDVGLENRQNTIVGQLSGGEQQRVAIARAFAVKPAILFADEPTGNLDVETGKQIADLMFRLRDQAGTTLVLVTHEPELAKRGDRTIEIESGQILSGG